MPEQKHIGVAIRIEPDDFGVDAGSRPGSKILEIARNQKIGGPRGRGIQHPAIFEAASNAALFTPKFTIKKYFTIKK
jgi:hypothetical protein